MPTQVMNDLRLLVSDIAHQVTILEKDAREILQKTIARNPIGP